MIKVGTRNSPLARWQTQRVISLFEELFHPLERLNGVQDQPAGVDFVCFQGSENVEAGSSPRFQCLEIVTPGDVDRATDLRESPANFFTKTLDDAVLNGEVDFAVHSAKDLPDPVTEGLDWFWLPASGDRRDVLIGSLDPKIIGVSSERRAAYAAKRFPNATCKTIRGNIEERIQQLDDGKFDLLIMAGVALQRLGLKKRITEWISLRELETPEAQGTMAVTFRKNDLRMTAIRNLFVKSATFVGAGVTEGHCTLDGLRALQSAEVCLYDALLDDSLLKHLPENAQKIYVGKRQCAHSQPQEEINQLLCDCVRKGKRTVRLKGGDAGIFGRLAEEVDALEEFSLASRVIPGISAMQTAASDTGILLTRRGVARGFSVMTPRLQGGGVAPIDSAARVDLPTVFFMSISIAADLAKELIADGMSKDTPCAFIFEAGSDRETVCRGTLAELPDVQKAVGLFIVGDIARYGFDQTLGALGGKRILLTCSEALMPQAVQAVHDFGGKPVIRPLIDLILNVDAVSSPRCSGSERGEDTASTVEKYDWIALTSPSSVRCFQELLLLKKIDFRSVPKIMTVGSGSFHALEKIGLGCDLMPASDFSAKGLLDVAAPIVSGQKVLRLRSQKAGTELADGLRAAGAEVEDVVLYENRFIKYDRCPEFEAVFFASASAVESFFEQWGAEALSGKIILAIGGPTRGALAVAGCEATVTGKMATVENCLFDLAQYCVKNYI